MRIAIEKKVLTTIVLFSVVILAITGFIIYPTIQQIKLLYQATYELRLDLEKKYEHALKVRASTRRTAEVKAAAQSFSRYLYHAGDELLLITTLENLATTHSLSTKIENSSLDKITDQRINLSLTTNGSFYNTLSYLSDLEHLPYYFITRRLRMVPVSKRPGVLPDTNTVDMNLDVSLYVNN